MSAFDSKHGYDDQERQAYNKRISRMRKYEYPMLKGMLAYSILSTCH
jgi:hypothetical protein